MGPSLRGCHAFLGGGTRGEETENDGVEDKMDKEEDGEDRKGGKGGEGKEEEETVRVCNPSSREAEQEAPASQHGLHKETVSKEHNQTTP